MISITIATAFLLFIEEKPLFEVAINTWHYHAIPYFLLLGIIAGMNSIYLTKCVLFFKKQAAKIQVHYHKIIFGAIILTISLLVLPQLYGDGYHAIKHSIISANTDALTLPLLLTILAILVMKPIITSITLSSGGDGGVFAPSLFIGAFLGLLTALCVNTFFNANVIPLNFMIIGMAAMLSASIHAPAPVARSGTASGLDSNGQVEDVHHERRRRFHRNQRSNAQEGSITAAFG